MLKKHILGLCEKGIRERLGSLDDLPHELANTVANIYYKMFYINIDWEQQKANPTLPEGVKEQFEKDPNTDIFKASSKYIEESFLIKHYFKGINGWIDNLRELKRRQPNNHQDYAFIVEIILDQMKYRINNLEKKSLIRRRIERKIKKRKVDEIPNLIDLLNI
jgi:hypothetical protein